MYKQKFVIIIPTYMRVEALGRCLAALEKQTIPPDEIIIVQRESDFETTKFIDKYRQKKHSLNIVVLCVTESGFLPPIKKGLGAAQGDYVGIIDDDVLVGAHWVETGISVFRNNNPQLGAISGASIGKFDAGTVFPSKLYWRGRFAAVNNMVKGTKNINALNEGNLIIRGEASLELVVDMRLNTGRIAHHGLDFGLQLIERGWEIKYDHRLNAEHLALRTHVDIDDLANINTYVHNLMHIVGKHFGKMRLTVFVLYNLVVGQHEMPGFIYGFLKRVTPSNRVSIARRALIWELLQRT